MKKLLLVAFVTACFHGAQAQTCTPTWPSGAGPGIQPDSATNLPVAYEGVPYSAVVQFKVPLDTVVLFNGSNVPATVNDITITNVTGLSAIPAATAFAYHTNPSSGVFPGGSVACVVITGTPAVGSSGDYPLSVDVTAHAHPNAFPTLVLPQSGNVSFFHILVQPFNGVAEKDVREQGMMAYPTLTNGETALNYFVGTTSRVEITVVNTLGQIVATQSKTAVGGANVSNLDMSALCNGQYVVVLKTNDAWYTARVTLNK